VTSATESVAPSSSDKPLISSRLIEIIAWCALTAALPFVAIDVVCGNWDHDGGFYLLRGYYIATGLKPYLDFGSIYPPLGDVITAIVLKGGFSHLVVAIMLPMLWVFATMLATALLVYRATESRSLAVLVAALVPWFSASNGGNHLTLEHCVSFFSCLAFVPLVSRSRLTPAAAFRAVLFAFAAVFSKQTGLVTVMVVAAAFIDRRHELTRKHILPIVAAVLAIPVGILAWLNFDIAGIYSNLVSRLGRYAAASPPPNWGVITWEFVRAPGTAYLMLAAIIIGCFLAARVSGVRLLALAAAAGIVVEFLPRIARDYPHYNLNIWPFIVLLVALALAHARETAAWSLRAALLLFAVVVDASLVFNTGGGGVSPLLQTYYPVAGLVSSITPEDATVRQYGMEPIIEFLAWRREELIERPWDPAWMYPTPPNPNSTIVVVHNRRQNTPALLASLQAQGFEIAGQTRSGQVITVLRRPRNPQGSAEMRTRALPGN
jgi:hypothetical protein